MATQDWEWEQGMEGMGIIYFLLVSLCAVSLVTMNTILTLQLQNTFKKKILAFISGSRAEGLPDIHL